MSENNCLNIEISTPENMVYSGKAKSIQIPTSMGQIEVLPGYASYIMEIIPGLMMFSPIVVGSDSNQMGVKIGKSTKDSALFESNKPVFYIGGGLLSSDGANGIRVMASVLESTDEVDENRALKSLERAESRLKDSLTSYEIIFC